MILAGTTLLLCGCGSTSTDVYEGKKPEITLKQFYSGPVHGYGIFQDASGEVKDRYYATLIPTWHGNEGTLVEKQWNEQGKLFFQQEWKVKLVEDGKNFTATATKIEGTVKGESRGYALHMQYSLLAPREDGGEVSVDSDDWTYLQPDGNGINKISMSKFGLHIGDVTYNLHKLAKGEKLHEGYLPQ
jgi:hypothetical protein